MDVLTLPEGSAKDRGRAHGEHFRARIHEIAEIRVELAVAQGGLSSEEALLDVARAHLPVLEAFDGPLSEEFHGIAEGAEIELGRLVVLNHYTDLKDVRDEECTSAVARTADGPVFGQTWDMHGSVEPYVCMLHIPAFEKRPETWAFSITGCLALAGMNSSGLGICINNLKSHDARVGVVWPALVRRMLAERGSEAALHVLQTAPMASGHHYLIGDAHRTYGVETSGERKAIVFDRRFDDGSEPFSYIHTNHCVSDEIDAVSWVSEWSTSFERYAWLEASVAERAIADRRDLWTRFGSHDGYPRSLCTHLASDEKPHAMKTCGAVVMDPARLQLWAVKGCAHEAEPSTYTFEER